MLGKEEMVYITKYAFTDGIIYQRAKTEGNIAQVANVYFHTEGKEWHRTLESAQAVAESMRLKKIASLKKQLIKYENMTFGVKTKWQV